MIAAITVFFGFIAVGVIVNLIAEYVTRLPVKNK